MREIPAALQAHLDSGATTLCWCWRITRGDGLRLGFTDHDRDLSFEDTLFEAASGFEGSEIRSELGLSVGNLEVGGALRSDRLSERDLEAGLYDGAEVEIYRVNWQAVAERLLVRAGTLGEIRRGRHAFTAEIRGLAQQLQQEQGRIFQHGCDADLGDQRCRVSLDLPAYRGTGSVAGVLSRVRLRAAGLSGHAQDWFTRGLLRWTSGANAGRAVEVKRHAVEAAGALVEIWQPMAEPVAAGDAFTITAGCDKQPGTCRIKFANLVNFRGFPHMPGNDFVTFYPARGEGGNDGGSLLS